jgi:hypothetical protein
MTATESPDPTGQGSPWDDDLDEIDGTDLEDYDHDEIDPAQLAVDDHDDTSATAGIRSRDELPVVFLHIGTYKAGTSYLQGRLADAAPRLREDGVLFPGRDGYASQVEAVRDAIGWEVSRRAPARTQWSELRDEILAWPGAAAVVSMEFLSTASRRTAAQIVTSFHPADVRIIVTARDLMRVVPSAWQETMQNRQTRSWPKFIEGVTSDHPTARDARFWAYHDPAEVVSRWVDAVGTDHVYVITVPPPGAPADLLWQRFCNVLGVEQERYATQPGAIRPNASLDTASAELLRRINTALPETFTKPMYTLRVKKFLAKEVLVAREGGRKPELPEPYWEWAVRRSRQTVRSLERSGAQVVGDLQELVPSDFPDGARPRPDEVSEREIADAAVDAIVGILTNTAAASEAEIVPTRRGQRRRRQRTSPA